MLQKFVEKDKVSIVSRFFALQVVKPSMLIYATCLSAPVGVDDEHTRMTVRVDHLFYSHGRRVPSYFQQRQQELLQQQEMREQQLGTVTTSGATSEYTPAVVNVPIRDVLADVVEFGEVAKNELRVDDVICGVVVSRQDVERRRLAAKQSKHVSRRVDDESRSYSDGEDCSPTAALTAWDVADLTGDRILLSFDASLLRDAVILTRIHRLGKVSNETRQYVYQDQSPSDDDNDGSGATSFLPNLLTYLEMTNAIDPFVFQHTCQRLNVDQYASGVSELAGRRDLVARGQYERLRDEQNAAYAVHCVKRGVEKFHLYKQHITAALELDPQHKNARRYWQMVSEKLGDEAVATAATADRSSSTSKRERNSDNESSGSESSSDSDANAGAAADDDDDERKHLQSLSASLRANMRHEKKKKSKKHKEKKKKGKKSKKDKK